MTLLLILIVIAVIVYFVVSSGDDEGTDETPSEDETTSLWQGEPGAAVLVAGDPALGAPPVVFLKSA